MRIDVSSQLANTENPHMHTERLHTLHVRCVQEIHLLNRKLAESYQQPSYPMLQQRLQELQQRQKFYQAQLSSLSVRASA